MPGNIIDFVCTKSFQLPIENQVSLKYPTRSSLSVID